MTDRRHLWPVAIAGLAAVLLVLLIPPAGLGPSPVGTADTGPGGVDQSETPAATDTSTPTATPTPQATSAGTETDTDATEDRERERTTTETDEAAAADTDDGTGPAGVLGGLLGWLIASVVAVGVGCVLSVEGKYRGWPGFVRLPIPSVSVFGASQSIAQSAMVGTVGAAATTEHVLDSLTVLGRGLTRSSGALLTALGRGVAGLVVLPAELLGGLAGAMSGLGTALAGVGAHTDRVDATPDTDPVREQDVSDADEEPWRPTSVEEAWQGLRDAIGYVPDSRTPVEIAEIAVDRGLPATPVRTITDAFRAVVYGGHSEERLRTTAIDAYERIAGQEGDR
ncbi:DUF4129 domain-containing protein [Halococcoides cellulosivorans]|uniref:Protein-glutamine gamma-glutamyltransferase-like C-terminal domain-containing protein n=1 Tax=Halococcoides cellulosivorans TaxID=1679096 RepID=A0A2R4X2G7_9EURY|nr:DUF4129 domain-containing protein [Halococcoides cellulosivorans]AWB28009.1 hypothetical protein HARCEL1_09955 [Halococcoides cellulosivorans]